MKMSPRSSLDPPVYSKKSETPWKSTATRELPRDTIPFVVYLAYLVLFALAPFTPAVDGISLIELYRKKFEGFSGIFAVSEWDIWTNILLYMPYGLLIAALPAVLALPWWGRIFLASGSAALLSFLLELGQLLLPRRPSFDDVIYNTIGALGGALLSRLSYVSLCRLARKSEMVFQNTAARALILGAYFIVLYGLFSVPLPLYFSNWDSDFPFQLGNESTLDRPWRGNLYLVALYDQALTAQDVRTNFTAGPAGGSSAKRISHGLLLLYDFSEGAGEIVHDRTTYAMPVDLRIQDPANVRWIAPNGLMFQRDTIIASLEPPAKLSAKRVSSHNELSLEAWIAPADLSQGGPARIVSYSKDLTHRNFTLGQQQGDIAFRLRTPVSGPNGTQPELLTAGKPLQGGAVQHLVMTFSDGIETLYVDAIERGKSVMDTKVALIDVVMSLLGQEFTLPLWSAFIFPVGILTYLVHTGWQRSGQAAWVPVVTASASMGLIGGVRVVALKSAEPSFFMIIATSSVLISILIAPLFLSTDQNTVGHRKSPQQ
jgi:glycopeptide antibiotics resistance protein